MKPRLGVNIDHVATLRQARGEDYPSVVDAACACFDHGADQITIHLREDRRHIQDTDVEAVHLVTKKYGKPLNLEMGASEQIVEIAIATAPDWICLVPENRQEVTTEGGLNLLDEKVFEKIKATCAKLRAGIPNVKISLFLESDLSVLEKAAEMKPEAVEIHTGEYARVYLRGDDYSAQIGSFKKAYEFLQSKSIATHAGHGLTHESVEPLLKEEIFEEYNIGHWIVCQALYDGLGNVVKNLKELMSR